jgi:anti-sigma regulatory factor (Ser/Thr protein kinase)
MSCDKNSAPKVATPEPAGGMLSFQIKLASDPRLLSVVRSTISELAAVWGFDERQCRDITLAVDEALSNVMRHAYGSQSDREIELICQARSDGLEFDFLDRGEPADLSRVCAQPLDEVALAGRGTHLIRLIMDEVRYERVGEGNRLCLRKYLTGARKADAAPTECEGRTE